MKWAGRLLHAVHRICRGILGLSEVPDIDLGEELVLASKRELRAAQPRFSEVAMSCFVEEIDPRTLPLSGHTQCEVSQELVALRELGWLKAYAICLEGLAGASRDVQAPPVTDCSERGTWT